ncbi:GFA family protein [Novosphingobium sp.]|uniref:GFA family protein n=1 Tax=Novosphingobium sp. TaxID=1874826 RepID=UPI0038B6F7B4
MTEDVLRGECYCRAVAYSVPDRFAYALICHCHDCQRTTGSAFKPFAGIAADVVSVERGAEHIRRLGDAANHNAFCGQCGSQLWAIVRDGAFAHVTLGTLTSPPTTRPSAHIFVRSQAPWHVIADDLPRYEEFPEG